eukprot:gene14533-17165_t
MAKQAAQVQKKKSTTVVAAPTAATVVVEKQPTKKNVVATTAPVAAVATKKTKKVEEPVVVAAAPVAVTQPKSILKKKQPVVEESSSEEEDLEDDVEEQDDEEEKQITQVITVGCYEHSIFGYEAILIKDHPELDNPKTNPDGLEVLLKNIFAYAAHNGCVKALASGANYLVSSSTDETMKVYKLAKREEYGTLAKHEGWINALTFYKDTHLIAASRDATLSVWRVKDWECLKQLKGHKEAVNSVSIHPSGKVALSVGADRRLFLWDLLRGVAAHYNKLPVAGTIVAWSPSGDHYAVATLESVTIYSAEGKELHKYPFAKHILAMKFFDNGKTIKTLEGHSTRIKAIDILKFNEVEKPYIVSISTDGNVVIWNIDSDLPVGFAETEARLTCMSISQINKVVENEDDVSIDAMEVEDEEEEEEQPQVVDDGPKMKVKIEYDGDKKMKKEPKAKFNHKQHNKKNKKANKDTAAVAKTGSKVAPKKAAAAVSKKSAPKKAFKKPSKK